MKQPEVSVIMGVYRPDEALLEQALESVLTQAGVDLELIVCDDGTPGGLPGFIAALARRESRLVLVTHRENQGLAAALNTCMAYARGRYIARQDADDVSLPERLRIQLDFLKAHPKYAFVGSGIEMYDQTGVWAKKKFPPRPQPEDFLFSLPFQHGTLLFRKEVLEKCGGYLVSKRTRRTEDYELLGRLYAQGALGYNLTQPLYRYWEDSRTLTRRPFRYRVDEVFVRQKVFRALGLYPRGLPYLIKPLAVGLLPGVILAKMKWKHYRLHSAGGRN